MLGNPLYQKVYQTSSNVASQTLQELDDCESILDIASAAEPPGSMTTLDLRSMPAVRMGRRWLTIV